jgi:hypothetical protein
MAGIRLLSKKTAGIPPGSGETSLIAQDSATYPQQVIPMSKQRGSVNKV